jgi:tRNA uridine 5-carboxymethylaminomethyl modification enzyme
MFTSRSEFRLSLRADNADIRLTRIGLEWGCVGASRASRFLAYEKEVRAALERARASIVQGPDGRRRSMMELVAIDSEQYRNQLSWLAPLSPRARNHIEIEARYLGYLRRQEADIRAFRREEELLLGDVNFARVGGLTSELRDKLARQRPASLGAASRIQGMTPAGLAALVAHVRSKAQAVRAK